MKSLAQFLLPYQLIGNRQKCALMKQENDFAPASLLGGDKYIASYARGIEAGDQGSKLVPAPTLSTLFVKLLAGVDRCHLTTDKHYLRLVSDIAELLPDEEVALLALYFDFVPPLRVRSSSGNPSQTPAIPNRKRGSFDG